jgi:hypothetical protein
MKEIIVFILLISISPWICLAKTDRVSIYISAPMRNGFLDSNRSTQDSIKDISNQLYRKKGIKIIDEREKADIVLTVVSRGIGSEEYGKRLDYKEHFNATELSSAPIIYNTAWISAVLQAGEYKRELIGTDIRIPGDTIELWRNCAKEIAGNVVAWIKANSALKTRTVKEENLTVAPEKSRGKIADVDGDFIYINLGSQHKVSVGDILEIVNLVKIVKDPDTGQTLSEITENVGKIQIEKVEMKFSVCKVLQAEKPVQIGQIVRDNNPPPKNRWNDLAGHTTYLLRLDDDILHIEADLSEAARRHGDSLSGELKRQGHAFNGTLKDSYSCELNDNPANSKTCSFEYGIKLTKITSHLIEGRIEGPPAKARLNCASCRWSKNPIHKYIELVPQNK